MRRGTSESRLLELEEQVALLTRLIPASGIPRSQALRIGLFKVRLTSELAATTDPSAPESATAKIITWDGTNVSYARPGDEITVYDFLMHTGDTAVSGTHGVALRGEDNRWWFILGGCGASDWEPVTPS